MGERQLIANHTVLVHYGGRGSHARPQAQKGTTAIAIVIKTDPRASSSTEIKVVEEEEDENCR